MAGSGEARRHPAHGVAEVDGHPTLVFLTVCTEGRRPWLADPAVHTALLGVWMDSQAWLVGRYVLMPDHIHLFAAMTDVAVPFDNWVRYWKSQFTKRHSFAPKHWQTDHWDTRIRGVTVYEEKWEYVRDNPVRKGLVPDRDVWPYQGELFEVRWD